MYYWNVNRRKSQKCSGYLKHPRKHTIFPPKYLLLWILWYFWNHAELEKYRSNSPLGIQETYFQDEGYYQFYYPFLSSTQKKQGVSLTPTAEVKKKSVLIVNSLRIAWTLRLFCCIAFVNIQDAPSSRSVGAYLLLQSPQMGYHVLHINVHCYCGGQLSGWSSFCVWVCINGWICTYV